MLGDRQHGAITGRRLRHNRLSKSFVEPTVLGEGMVSKVEDCIRVAKNQPVPRREIINSLPTLDAETVDHALHALVTGHRIKETGRKEKHYRIA